MPPAHFNKECVIEIVQMVEWTMQKKKQFCTTVYQHLPAHRPPVGESGKGAAGTELNDQPDPIFHQSRLSTSVKHALWLFAVEDGFTPTRDQFLLLMSSNAERVFCHSMCICVSGSANCASACSTTLYWTLRSGQSACHAVRSGLFSEHFDACVHFCQASDMPNPLLCGHCICPSADLQIWFYGYAGCILMADEVRFAHSELQGIFRTANALRMRFKALESKSVHELSTHDLIEETEVCAKLVNIVKVLSLSQGRIICAKRDIAVIANLAIALTESAVLSTSMDAASPNAALPFVPHATVLHDTLVAVLDLLLTIAKSDIAVLARALEHQEFTLCGAVYSNANILPPSAILIAAKLHSLLTLHFADPSEAVRWEQFPRFLRVNVLERLGKEKEFISLQNTRSSGVAPTVSATEPADVAQSRVVRQVLAKQMQLMYANASFPRALLEAAGRASSAGPKDPEAKPPSPPASPRTAGTNSSDGTSQGIGEMLAGEKYGQQLIGILFAMLEGSADRVANPSDRIEMSPIKSVRFLRFLSWT